MKTKPVNELLPLTLDEDLKKILDAFSDLISEMVYFGTHVLKWAINKPLKGDEHVPTFLLFRRILELADSISILIKSSCIDPCEIILRSLFESLLSLEYLLSDKTKSKRRAIDFIVWTKQQKILSYRRWDPGDPMFNDFQALLRRDDLLKNTNFNEIPEVKESIRKLQESLRFSGYEESAKEYNKIKRLTRKHPKYWFNLHNGPTSIEELARYLNRPAQYRILYQLWSSAVHGTKLDRFEIDGSKTLFIIQIRCPENAQFITFMTSSFLITCIRLFINFYIPEKRDYFRNWYKEEIRNKYTSLGKEKFIIV